MPPGRAFSTRLEQFEINRESKDDTGDPEEQPEANTNDDIDSELLASPLAVETCKDTATGGRTRTNEKNTKRHSVSNTTQNQVIPVSVACYAPIMSTATQGRRIHNTMMQMSFAERPILVQKSLKVWRVSFPFVSIGSIVSCQHQGQVE